MTWILLEDSFWKNEKIHLKDNILGIQIWLHNYTREPYMLEHWCEDRKKLEGWKIKHQVIKL